MIPKKPDAVADHVAPSLTERQRQVLFHLGRGLSEKEIALELNISPGRVTQLVRALKDRLGTERRSGLVAAAKRLPLYDKTVEQISSVPDASIVSDASTGALPDEVSVSDVMPLRHPAPWERDAFRVGPGAFDGSGGKLRIAAEIIAISLGIPLLLVLLIAARWSITAAFSPAP